MEEQSTSFISLLKKEYIYIFLIILIICIYFPSFVLVKGAFLVADCKYQHFPWALVLAEHIKNFRLPWWTSQIHCGFPLVAEGQVGAFYLPNLIFYFLFPIKVAYAYLSIFHLVLAGIFMYLFARFHNLTKKGSMLAVICFLFGSAAGGAFYNLNSLKVLCWFPLTLYLIDHIIDEKKLWFTILLGVIFSFQILAGYLQIACFSLLISGLYFVFLLISNVRRANKVFLFSAILKYFISLLIALLISAPQILLTYQLAINSTRGKLTESFAYLGSFSPFSLVTTIFPWWEFYLLGSQALYIGLFGLFFAFLALVGIKKNRNTRIIIWMFLISLLLAMGRYSPLYVGLVKLTKFYNFRTPAKFIFFSVTFLAILAGKGLTHFEKYSQRNFSPLLKRTTFWFSLFTGLILLAVSLGKLLVVYFRDNLLFLGKFLVRKYIYHQPHHPYSLEHYYYKVKDILDSFNNLVSLSPYTLFVFSILAVQILLIYLILKKKIKVKRFIIYAFMLLSVELYCYGFLNIKSDYGDYTEELRETRIIDFLRRQTEPWPFKIYSPRSLTSRLELVSNYNMYYGIEDIGIYAPFVNPRYKKLLWELGNIDDSMGIPEKVEEKTVKDRLGVLSMLNVKYIQFNDKLEDPRLEFIMEEDGNFLYRNKEAMPRAYLVERYEVCEDEAEILKKLNEKTFNPAAKVYLENSLPVFMDSKDSKRSTVRGEEYVSLIDSEGGRIELLAKITSPKFLVLTDVNFPGWEVFVDEKKSEILTANYILKSVYLLPGRHRVLFRYKPAFF